MSTRRIISGPGRERIIVQQKLSSGPSACYYAGHLLINRLPSCVNLEATTSFFARVVVERVLRSQ